MRSQLKETKAALQVSVGSERARRDLSRFSLFHPYFAPPGDPSIHDPNNSKP